MLARGLPAVFALALLAGCAYPLPNPPVSMQPLGTVLINHAPESANSLPPGAQVLAPLTSVVGQVNVVPVEPLPY